MSILVRIKSERRTATVTAPDSSITSNGLPAGNGLNSKAGLAAGPAGAGPSGGIGCGAGWARNTGSATLALAMLVWVMLGLAMLVWLAWPA